MAVQQDQDPPAVREQGQAQGQSGIAGAAGTRGPARRAHALLPARRH
nr:Nbc35 [Streptomyces sp.]